jgi:branched-chain amino acid transport system substrate-binding protein
MRTPRFVFVFLVVALVAPRGASGAEAIVIGEINPRTGVLAVHGTAVHQGILLAIEEANAKGGIRGRPITLLSRDDEGKPERAIAAAEELIARHGAVALIGGYVDSLVGPISEAALRTKTPYLATASLDERLTGKGNRYFFRVSSLAPYVSAMTGVVREVFKARTVAILYSTTPGASQLARKQKEVFEQAGIRVTVFEPFSPGLSDFTPFLARVRDHGADVLISNTFFADHLLLVRQMAQAGIKVRAFLGAFGMEFPAVIKELGPAAEGLFGTTAWQPGVALAGREAASKAFTEAFAKRFEREPVPLAMHGYAAAKTLLTALSATASAGHPVSEAALREALARADVETPMGRVRFNDAGDPLHYERVIIQIQGGRHVVVYPPSRATAPAIYPAK